MDELKIIKYLDGEMSGEELKNFEDEIRMNPLLEEEVSKFREIQEFAIKLLSDPEGEDRDLDPAIQNEIYEAVGEFKKDPKAYGDIPAGYRQKLKEAEGLLKGSLGRDGGRGGNGSTVMIRRIWYSAAAVVILAITIAVLLLDPFNKLSSDQVYTQYFSPFQKTEDIIEIARDDNDFLFATQVYEAGDFERAVVLFEILADSSELRSWSLFYAGSSYMSLNQTDEAIDLFLLVLLEAGDEVKSPARWQLALCYLKSGSIENAREQLALLTDDQDYRKDANRILRMLR